MEWQPWVQGLTAMLETLLKHPKTTAELWTLLIVGFLAGALALRITASACGMERATVMRAAAGTLLGLLLILLGLTVVSVLEWASGAQLLLGVGTGISLILVIPLLGALLRGNYFVALFAWLISLAAVAGVILILSAMFAAGAATLKNAEKAGAHRQQLDEVIGGPPAPPATVPRR